MDISNIESFKRDLIKQINKYRKEHGVKKLSNESKIDKIAQKFADKLSKKGKLDYSYNQYNGEDLGESVYQSENYLAPLKLAKVLYDENIEYNYQDKDPEPSNFTQMVWKNTQLIGFGMQKSKGKYYFVINYYPTGNIDGQFQKNVFPLGTKLIDTSNNDEKKQKKENMEIKEKKENKEKIEKKKSQEIIEKKEKKEDEEDEENKEIKVKVNKDYKKKNSSIKKDYIRKDSTAKKDYVRRDSTDKKDYMRRDSTDKKDYVRRDSTDKKDYKRKESMGKKDYKRKESMGKNEYKRKESMGKNEYMRKESMGKKDYKRKESMGKNEYIRKESVKNVVNNDKKHEPKKKEYIKEEILIRNKSNKNGNKKQYVKVEEFNRLIDDDDYFGDDNIELEFITHKQKTIKDNKDKDIDSKIDIINQLIFNKKKEKLTHLINQVEIEKKYVKSIKSSTSVTEFISDNDDFYMDALDSHNKYRKMHHVEPLKLNKDLCKIAEDYAKKLANEIGHLEHSENCYDDDILGENLFYCGGMEPTGASVSKNWYGENKNHNFSGDWKKGTGHFTQMVWKETKEVGFGKYKNKKGQTFVVANYYPAGNVMGFFKYNVFKP